MNKIGYLEKTAKIDRSQKGDKMDLLAGVPLVGGALHGALKPARGASAFETSAIEGLGGLVGGAGLGALGAGAGSLLAPILRRNIADDKRSDYNDADLWASLIGAALLGVPAAALGTAGGSYLGRYASQRDTLTPEELKEAMIAAAQAEAAAKA